MTRVFDFSTKHKTKSQLFPVFVCHEKLNLTMCKTVTLTYFRVINKTIDKDYVHEVRSLGSVFSASLRICEFLLCYAPVACVYTSRDYRFD